MNYNDWVFLAIVSSILFALSELLFKHAGSSKTLRKDVFACWFMILLAIPSTLYLTSIQHSPSVISKDEWKLIAATAAIMFLGNMTFWKSVDGASNPALVRAFVGLEMIIILMVSYFVYNDALAPIQIFGMVMIMSGAGMIIYHQIKNKKG
jgi:drug/metabolite transporter (DMT)-like permease